MACRQAEPESSILSQAEQLNAVHQIFHALSQIFVDAPKPAKPPSTSEQEDLLAVISVAGVVACWLEPQHDQTDEILYELGLAEDSLRYCLRSLPEGNFEISVERFHAVFPYVMQSWTELNDSFQPVISGDGLTISMLKAAASDPSIFSEASIPFAVRERNVGLLWAELCKSPCC